MKLKKYFIKSLENIIKQKIDLVFPGHFYAIPVIGGPVEFKISKKDILKSMVLAMIYKGEFYDDKGNVVNSIDLKNEKYGKTRETK